MQQDPLKKPRTNILNLKPRRSAALNIQQAGDKPTETRPTIWFMGAAWLDERSRHAATLRPRARLLQRRSIDIGPFAPASV